MKNFKRIISFILLLTGIVTNSTFAYGDDVNSNVVEIESDKTVTISSEEGYKVKTTYNKGDNTEHMVTMDQENEIKNLYESDKHHFIVTSLNGEVGKRKMSSQYTILNYEYEEWFYPNFKKESIINKLSLIIIVKAQKLIRSFWAFFFLI